MAEVIVNLRKAWGLSLLEPSRVTNSHVLSSALRAEFRRFTALVWSLCKLILKAAGIENVPFFVVLESLGTPEKRTDWVSEGHTDLRFLSISLIVQLSRVAAENPHMEGLTKLIRAVRTLESVSEPL